MASSTDIMACTKAAGGSPRAGAVTGGGGGGGAAEATGDGGAALGVAAVAATSEDALSGPSEERLHATSGLAWSAMRDRRSVAARMQLKRLHQTDSHARPAAGSVADRGNGRERGDERVVDAAVGRDELAARDVVLPAR